MRRLVISLLLAIFTFLPEFNVIGQEGDPTAEPPQVAIYSPTTGQVLQGTIAITGRTSVEGFSIAELRFSYMQDLADTWFLIYESDEAVSDGELTQWDTSTITDGEYKLRLVVTLQDGSQLTSDINNLRVRNYTPIETNTPEPNATRAPGDTPIPTITPTSTITPLPPSATPLPPNPAIISSQEILLSMGKGALVAVSFFALLGLYQLIRSATGR